MEWQALSTALLTASQSTLGNMERRHQDWFDDNVTDIRSLIHDRNAAHDALLRNPTSRTLHERFSSKRATVQPKLRWMENNWWAENAAQIQSYANIDDTKSFYEALKGVYGPRHFSLHPVRNTDDDLIMNKELILKRWAEYLQNLLSMVHTTDPGFPDDLPTLPIIPKLDDYLEDYLLDVPNLYELPDGSHSFKDFQGHRNNRFAKLDSAMKNRIQTPSKILHFFNAPPNITEDELREVCSCVLDSVHHEISV